MLFPILSAAATLAVIASFVLPLFVSEDLRVAFDELLASTDPKGGETDAANGTASSSGELILFGIAFAFYFVMNFVTIFFNAALLGAADRKFRGEPGGVSVGLSIAMSRLPQILGWSLVSAVIGTILRALEERVGFLGKIAILLVGAAWAIASYFVLPALVLEGLGPIAALKRSVAVIKKTWGEGLVVAIGLGLVGFVITLLALGIVVGGVLIGATTKSLVLSGFIVAFGALLLVTWGIVASTLRSIVQVALYRYATEGAAPAGFDAAAMQAAFAAKK